LQAPLFVLANIRAPRLSMGAGASMPVDAPENLDESAVRAIVGEAAFDEATFEAAATGGTITREQMLNAQLEAAIVAALSAARQEPSALAQRIKSRLQHFRGAEFYPPERGGKVAVATKEGVAAVKEALSYLSGRTSMRSLELPVGSLARRALRLAAEDHLIDKGTVGTIGHDGTDGSTSGERQMRYGAWSGACGECLWFGREGVTAETIVEDLVIDDNVKDRSHRASIFDARYAVCGVRVGAHKTFGSMAVIEFATAYEGDEARVLTREATGPPKVTAPAGSGAATQKTQWTNLGPCAHCGERIHGGSVIEVETLGKFHKKCFQCRACATSLVGVPWKAEKGVAYCSDCHAEHFALTCAGCARKITGSGVNVNGVAYHLECKPAVAGVIRRHQASSGLESKPPAAPSKRTVAAGPSGKQKAKTQPTGRNPPSMATAAAVPVAVGRNAPRPGPSMGGAKSSVNALVGSYADL